MGKTWFYKLLFPPFFSLLRKIRVWMSWVLPFGDQQVRVRTNH